MKFLSIIFTISFTGISLFGQAQNAQQTTVSDTKAGFTKSTKLSNTSNTVVSQPVRNTQDGYMGWKKIILKNLTVSEIPADFPKYQEGTAAEEYKLQIRAWAEANKHLLTEEAKKKAAQNQNTTGSN